MRRKFNYEDARDFAGADWQNMRPESRYTLLRAHGLSTVFQYHTWWQLPPSVKQALTKSVMERKQAVAA